MSEPTLLDRVRVAGSNIRVITPRPRTTRGSPFGSAMEWLALEERFTFYGVGITFISSVPSAVPAVADPAAPVNGPFSADFKWATLPDVQATPIRFTQGQAKVFEALWSFKGTEVDDEKIMQRAGQKSDKRKHWDGRPPCAERDRHRTQDARSPPDCGRLRRWSRAAQRRRILVADPTLPRYQMWMPRA